MTRLQGFGWRTDLGPRMRRPVRVVVLARLVALGLAVLLALGSGCRSMSASDSGRDETAAGESGSGATSAGKSNGGSASAGEDAEARRSIEAVALALLPVDAWTESWLLRQRVEVEWLSGSEGFDAVLQKRPGELALVGLGPMNLVGFRLALVAAGLTAGGAGAPRIEFENRSGRALPFSPGHILADVQRAFYPWLPEPWLPESWATETWQPASCRRESSDPDPDPERGRTVESDRSGGCERSGRQGEVAIWERRVENRLVERRFAIAGRLDAGEVRIRYADWRGEPAVATRIELENEWFGYRLTIETLEATPLPPR